ncbi:hypothetical protein PI126_g11278 [Phytophthora idaei]|nr:hypothetical protein PI126_g11278 [Phytophthora idaei]
MWERFVENGVKATGTARNTSEKHTYTEEHNYDVDLTEYYDTVRLMDEMETMQDCGDQEDEESCPPTQPTTVPSSTTLTEPITPSVPATLSNVASLTSSATKLRVDCADIVDPITTTTNTGQSGSNVGVYVLPSLVINLENFPSPPRLKLFSMKLIVLPVIIASCHWTLIGVAMYHHGKLTVHMYDPTLYCVVQSEDGENLVQ